MWESWCAQGVIKVARSYLHTRAVWRALRMQGCNDVHPEGLVGLQQHHHHIAAIMCKKQLVS